MLDNLSEQKCHMYNKERENTREKERKLGEAEDALTYLIQINDLLMFNEDY